VSRRARAGSPATAGAVTAGARGRVGRSTGLTPTRGGALNRTRRSLASSLPSSCSKMTGARTVPRVFVNGKCIGGGDDTAALAASGRLAKMLA
jgi:hypothetical protein